MERSHPGYSADALLADGTIAQIRERTDADRSALIRLHADASESNFYHRFLSLSREMAEHFVARLSSADRAGRDLVAIVGGQIVALVTIERLDADAAEMSLFVADRWHGRGIGTLLLEHAGAVARAAGIVTLHADVLAVNAEMLRVFHTAGYETTMTLDADTVTVRVTNTLTERAIDAADERERTAERASLRALFEPASVAVVGVSREGGVGRAISERILASGYRGPVYVVNPHLVDVPGAIGIRRLGDAPLRVDLAIVAVPAAAVEGVIREAAETGVRAAVVITSGFAEAGVDGQSAQARLTAIARAASMRLVGPNCFGVLSRLREISLDATFSKLDTEPGGLAIGSQSGGVGMAILGDAHDQGVGVATFVSLGNKADVSGNDLLAAWTDDSDIGAVGLYLESFGNPRKFVRMARACGRRKPVIAVFGGSSTAGRRAGVSHTAGNLTSDRFLRALCEAAGVIAVPSPDALLDVANLVLSQPLPGGPRVGIVGNAGGLGILAADEADRCRLTVADVDLIDTQDTKSGVRLANPHDLGAGANPAAYGAAAGAMARCGQVDALLVIVGATAVTDLDAIIAAVQAALAGSPALPCALVVVGAALPRRTGLACYGSVERAVKALSCLVAYASWRSCEEIRAARDERPSLPRDLFPAVSNAPRLLDAADTLEVLDRLGVDQPAYRMLMPHEEVDGASPLLGRPLVAKVCRAGVAHKSDLGFVTRDLRTPAAVEAAVQRLRLLSGSTDPILLQEQIEGAVDLAIGIVNDPQVGPLLMLSTGGVELDLWADQTYLLTPVTEDRVRRALTGLRSWPLLNGFRGKPIADIDAFVDLALEVSDVAEQFPQLAELDLNPVIVRDKGSGVMCVDAKIRLQPVADEISGAPALARPRVYA